MHKIISLTQLSLQNFATFKNQMIQFDESLNVIVGETGSGKSLILEAVQFIFGNRADKRIIRKNCLQACVEATFQVNNNAVNQYFDQLGYPVADDEIVLKRVLYSTGKSKIFINGQTAKISDLISVCKRFIDLVGQFENQKLQLPSYQLKLVDQYANLNKQVLNFTGKFEKLIQLQINLQQLVNKKKLSNERVDYLEFQIEQIKSINPTELEEEKLLLQKNNILNSEKRSSIINDYINILFTEDTESGIINQISQINKLIQKNQHITPEISLSENDFDTISTILNNIYSTSLKSINADINDIDPDLIFDRLDHFQKLKFKFGPTITDVMQKLETFENEYNLLKHECDLSKKIEDDIFALKNELHHDANIIHAIRVTAAKKLSKELTQAINQLKMVDAKIEVKVDKTNELNYSGMTYIQFMAETNPGEGIYPIAHIASGGELSRILLAMRQVLSSKDTISIFFFDEIDTGIGGETALSIADALKTVSKSSQVVAVSHLPQIAAKAHMLQVVSKHTEEDSEQVRTYSDVSYIKGREVINYAMTMAPIQ